MNGSMQRLPFWDTLSADAQRVGSTINPKARLLSRILQLRRAMKQKPGFACVFWLRVNQEFIRRGWRGQCRIRMWRMYRFSNDISPYADIGPGLFLPHYVDVTIGGAVKIGANATILNGVTLISFGEPHMTRIGNNVTIYTGAKVIKPVSIGDNSVIGAMSLCNKDIPPNCVMYGIPPHTTIKPK